MSAGDAGDAVAAKTLLGAISVNTTRHIVTVNTRFITDKLLFIKQ
jgi:hypothetical protein